LKFNVVKALPRTYAEQGILILDVGPDEEIFCFTKEYVEYLNGVSSQWTVKAMIVNMATVRA